MTRDPYGDFELTREVATLEKRIVDIVVEVRAHRCAGKKLAYDGPNMRITNDAGAHEFLSPVPRAGWKSM